MKRFMHVFTFMKTCVVHNNNALRWQCRRKVLYHPSIENEGIDGTFKQRYREQFSFMKRSNHIRSCFGSPVVTTITTLAFSRVAVCPRHVLCKTTFINVHNRSIFFSVSFECFTKRRSSFGVRFRVLQSFFYSSPPSALTLSKYTSYSRLAALLFHVGRRQVLFSHLPLTFLNSTFALAYSVSFFPLASSSSYRHFVFLYQTAWPLSPNLAPLALLPSERVFEIFHHSSSLYYNKFIVIWLYSSIEGSGPSNLSKLEV